MRGQDGETVALHELVQFDRVALGESGWDVHAPCSTMAISPRAGGVTALEPLTLWTLFWTPGFARAKPAPDLDLLPLC
jgi:hypothetical protein